MKVQLCVCLVAVNSSPWYTNQFQLLLVMSVDAVLRRVDEPAPDVAVDRSG